MKEKKSIEPISEEEFKEKARILAEQNHAKREAAFLYDGILSLRNFSGVSKYKSIRRAIKKGHLSLYGDLYPKRPFSNKKRGKRTETHTKKKIYEQFRNR